MISEEALNEVRQTEVIQKDNLRQPSYEDFLNYYRKNIKHDDVALQIVFLTGLSAYTKDPINLFMRGPSSIGKTYITTEVLKLFPKNDVWLIGSMSPKSLIHRYGDLYDRDGRKIDLRQDKPRKDASEEEKEEWRKRLEESYTVIDLWGKILVFLEAPSLETFGILRPLLSHDSEEIRHEFVEKTERGLWTKTIVLRGWPATIFCTTNERYFEELATRSMTITPNMSAEKYRAANLRSAEKAMYGKFLEDHEAEPLRGHLKFISETSSGIKGVLIPFAEALAVKFPSMVSRTMRDFNTFLRFLKASAIFSCRERPLIRNDGLYLVTTTEDLDRVQPLFSESYETTLTGLPEHILYFFHEICEKMNGEGFKVMDAVRLYNARAEKKVSKRTIERWITSLEEAGFLNSEPDPEDRRSNIITTIKQPEICDTIQIALILDNFGENEAKDWFLKIATNSRHEKSALILNLSEENTAETPSDTQLRQRQGKISYGVEFWSGVNGKAVGIEEFLRCIIKQVKPISNVLEPEERKSSPVTNQNEPVLSSSPLNLPIPENILSKKSNDFQATPSSLYTSPPQCRDLPLGQVSEETGQEKAEISAISPCRDFVANFSEPENRVKTPEKQEISADESVSQISGLSAPAIPTRIFQLEAPAPDTGRQCGNCRHFKAQKCQKKPDLVMISPGAKFAENCEFYEAVVNP